MAKKCKINPNELETANLVDIFNVGEYFIAPPRPLKPSKLGFRTSLPQRIRISYSLILQV